MSKFEKYLTTWNEFDNNCKHLEELFEKNSPSVSCNLQVNYLAILGLNLIKNLKLFKNF